MKQHRYRLTLEHIAAIKAETPLHEPLQFEAVNHDDLFAIIERLREARLFPGDESTAFAVGLKLFTETMLMHRDHPLFSELQGPIGDFMKKLKAGVKAAADGAQA